MSTVVFEDVTKKYPIRGGWRMVLERVSFELPRNRSVGILGVNGAGKSTLLRLIAGSERPNRGRIERRVRVSWPLGFAGGLHGSLSGYENAAFVARVYGQPQRPVRRFVESFSELGAYLEMPVKTYSSGMRARLAFALSMAIDFECYLVDEITGVGDRPFQAKCDAAFAARRARASVIMVSHNMATIRRNCDVAAILTRGGLCWYPTVDRAAEAYRRMNLEMVAR